MSRRVLELKACKGLLSQNHCRRVARLASSKPAAFRRLPNREHYFSIQLEVLSDEIAPVISCSMHLHLR